MSSCLGPAAKRAWRGLRARLGLLLRPSCRAGAAAAAGLGRLRTEVRTCEYSDVHVMWEMLTKQPSISGTGSGEGRRRATAGKSEAAAARRARAGRSNAWSRLASYCCAL